MGIVGDEHGNVLGKVVRVKCQLCRAVQCWSHSGGGLVRVDGDELKRTLFTWCIVSMHDASCESKFRGWNAESALQCTWRSPSRRIPLQLPRCQPPLPPPSLDTVSDGRPGSAPSGTKPLLRCRPLACNELICVCVPLELAWRAVGEGGGRGLGSALRTSPSESCQTAHTWGAEPDSRPPPSTVGV